jgi:GrpB-like predicted nucleotidyltransferase (UPF0157 family)/GNAT superfamily N-acetyltransferase
MWNVKVDKAMKKIEILPYSPAWGKIFEHESTIISEAFGDSSVQVYHIGSASVPGLSAKENIDILCVTDDLTHSLILENLGYVFKGELNIPLRYYFSKNIPGLKVNLHVAPPNHGFIELNLCFRNYLRNNEKSKLAYENLKYKLAQDPRNFERNGGGFIGYTLEKNSFIKSTLEEANFSGLIVNFCIHISEWESYHRIRSQLLFAPIGIEYDQNHPTIYAENHYHLVLYKGTIIVSVAQIEVLSDDTAILRSLATDVPFQNLGYGAFFLRFIEKWLKNKGVKIIKTHATERAENFYRKLAYDNMEFDDISISNSTTKLGKTL